MKLDIVATNANLKNETTGHTTIWARDAAGNEVSLVLNERLTKRILDAQVSARVDELTSGLTGLSDELRTATDKAEASLREVHNDLFAKLRSEFGIRKPRDVPDGEPQGGASFGTKVTVDATVPPQ